MSISYWDVGEWVPIPRMSLHFPINPQEKSHLPKYLIFSRKQKAHIKVHVLGANSPKKDGSLYESRYLFFGDSIFTPRDVKSEYFLI